MTVRQGRIGGAFANPACVGCVDSSATLPTTRQSLHSLFDAGLTSAITTTPKAVDVYELGGGLILDPGAFVCDLHLDGLWCCLRYARRGN